MPPAGFEPAVPPSERMQTHALESARPLGSVVLSVGGKIILNWILKKDGMRMRTESACLTTGTGEREM
jgi:hypothetical protein